MVQERRKAGLIGDNVNVPPLVEKKPAGGRVLLAGVERLPALGAEDGPTNRIAREVA